MSLWLTLVLLAQIDKLWGTAARRGAWFTYIADVNILPLPRSSAGKTVVTTKQAVPPRGAPTMAFGAAKTKSRSDESRCGLLLYCLCALCHLTAQTTEDLFLRRDTKAVTEACAEQSSVTYFAPFRYAKGLSPRLRVWLRISSRCILYTGAKKRAPTGTRLHQYPRLLPHKLST